MTLSPLPIRKKKRLTDSIRTLYRLDIIEQKQGLRLEFEGNGFLYKMVRNITGTLVDIAAGKERSRLIFTKRRSPLAGPPPRPPTGPLPYGSEITI